MKRLGCLAAALICFGAAAPAMALVEARLTYGLLVSNPNLGSLYTGTSTVPSVAPNYGLGADVLIFPPLMSWGFGLRQENLGLNASGGGLEFKSTATRSSAVLAYRFINTLLHVGTIFTYGLAHSGGVEVTEGGGTLSLKWEPGSVSSYSAGIEAGIGLGLFVLGAEAGYQSMTWNKMKDSTGTSTSRPNTDMSGTYSKIYLGLGI